MLSGLWAVFADAVQVRQWGLGVRVPLSREPSDHEVPLQGQETVASTEEPES